MPMARGRRGGGDPYYGGPRHPHYQKHPVSVPEIGHRKKMTAADGVLLL